MSTEPTQEQIEAKAREWYDKHCLDEQGEYRPRLSILSIVSKECLTELSSYKSELERVKEELEKEKELSFTFNKQVQQSIDQNRRLIEQLQQAREDKEMLDIYDEAINSMNPEHRMLVMDWITFTTNKHADAMKKEGSKGGDVYDTK